MKLKSKHLVEILKNISDIDYLCTKNQLHKLLSESLDNNNIITLSAEHILFINTLCSKESNIKKYLQKEGLIEEEDKNPFKKDLSSEDIKDLNNVLRNTFDGNPLGICESAGENIVTGERRELEKRSLYVIPGYQVILHNTKYGGTVIEIKKRD